MKVEDRTPDWLEPRRLLVDLLGAAWALLIVGLYLIAGLIW